MMLRSPATYWGWCFAVALLAPVGCSTMRPSAESDAQAHAAAGSVPQCTIDVRAAGKSPQVGTVDIGEDATVQQVLDKSRVMKKFTRMKLELYRKLPSGDWHKMVVEYDRSSKKVDAMHDYHVRPGDRLVVMEDTSDIFDDMMNSTLGPLGSMGRR